MTQPNRNFETTDATREESSTSVSGRTLQLEIIDVNLGPRLFSENIRPGSQVVYATATIPFTVRFDGDQEPFQNVGSSFQVPAGQTIEQTVREDIVDQEFPFQIEAQGQIIQGLLLHVTRNALLEKSGFTLSPERPILRIIYSVFIPKPPQLILNCTNNGKELRYLSVKGMNDLIACLAIPGSGGIEELPLPLPNPPERLVANIQLSNDSTCRLDGQNGGTEQVQILIEPD